MELPELSELLGAESHRLRGIPSWEVVYLLGARNLASLTEFTRRTIQAVQWQGGSREELTHLTPGLRHLLQLQATHSEEKPLLPRLRNESFRMGESVVIYVGDTPNNVASAEWLRGTVTVIEKSQKPEFRDGSPNAGYYWRVTATFSESMFPGVDSISFSTTEPRAIPYNEFTYLRKAICTDTTFLQIYVANAYRVWHPIWCLERGLTSAGSAMDMEQWLVEGNLKTHE